MYSRTLYLHALNKNDNVYAMIDFSNLPEITQGQKSQLNVSAIYAMAIFLPSKLTQTFTILVFSFVYNLRFQFVRLIVWESRAGASRVKSLITTLDN